MQTPPAADPAVDSPIDPAAETATPEGDYKVRLDIFEGPMDLLLHLIKVNEMEITDIPISRITQQYFSYLRLMEQMDLDVAGDFLVMASTLINIKLRSLLPETHEEEIEDEEVDEFISAQALMDKLVEYRRFKEAAATLKMNQTIQANMFLREVALPRMTNAEDDADLQMDLDKLLGAFSRVLRFAERRDWHLVTEEEFSVEEKMDWLEQRLLLEERIDAEDLFKACRSKLEMIVVLLATLELCHLRRVCVAQSEAFGSILIFPQNEGPQPLEEEPEFEPWPEPLPPEEASASGQDADGELQPESWDGDDDEDEDELMEEERSAEIVELNGSLSDASPAEAENALETERETGLDEEGPEAPHDPED
jgi:segregation and condensation protein A